jgi:hypothetical protein
MPRKAASADISTRQLLVGNGVRSLVSTYTLRDAAREGLQSKVRMNSTERGDSAKELVAMLGNR